MASPPDNPLSTGFSRARWAREVVRTLDISPSAAHLLHLLASYTDDCGGCWPSQDRELAPSMGVLPRRVRQLTRELEAAGVLEVVRTPRQANGRRGRNVYRLLTGGHTGPPVTENRRSSTAGDRGSSARLASLS
jgi:hypothetical protein